MTARVGPMQNRSLDLGTCAEAFESGTEALRALAESYLHPRAVDAGGSRADQIRQERVRQALRVVLEANGLLDKAGIVQRSLHLKVFSQILEQASCETDEDLLVHWAGLLAASAAGAPVHVSYPHILAQLSAAEFRLVDAMYQWYLDHPRETGDPAREIGPLNHGFPTPTLKQLARLAGDKFRISMVNLFRLGLCISEEEPKAGSRDVFLTPLGFALVRECRGPARTPSR